MRSRSGTRAKKSSLRLRTKPTSVLATMCTNFSSPSGPLGPAHLDARELEFPRKRRLQLLDAEEQLPVATRFLQLGFEPSRETFEKRELLFAGKSLNDREHPSVVDGIVQVVGLHGPREVRAQLDIDETVLRMQAFLLRH